MIEVLACCDSSSREYGRNLRAIAVFVAAVVVTPVALFALFTAVLIALLIAVEVLLLLGLLFAATLVRRGVATVVAEGTAGAVSAAVVCSATVSSCAMPAEVVFAAVISETGGAQ